MNPKAVFVPCNNHSLNLAGVHAVGAGTQSVTFFGIVGKGVNILLKLHL